MVSLEVKMTSRVITVIILLIGESFGDNLTSAVSQETSVITSTLAPYHDTYGILIEKYSGSEKYLTIQQLQTLLDKLYNVNATVPNNDTNIDSECKLTKGECVGATRKGCLMARDIFKKLKIEDGKFNIDSFEAVCPLILRQIETNICVLHTKGDKSKDVASGRPTTTEVWGLGFLSVTIISACSLIGVSVLPLMKKKFYKQFLTVLIGLAVGSLSSSSLFHLIPQSFNLMEHDTHHNYLNVSLMMWLGIWCFFMTERLLRIVSDKGKREENKMKIKSNVGSPAQTTPDQEMLQQSVEDSNGCATVASFGHIEQEMLQQSVEDSNGCATANPEVIYDYQQQAIRASFGHIEQEMLQQSVEDSNGCATANPEVIYDYQQQAIRASFGHIERPHNSKHSHNQDLTNFKSGKDSAIATVAWMVIFGDGLHNFIDGLSIGAAFTESTLTGISISVAVLCEEFPHELGDFAVLLNAGMTMKQALLYNFLSASTCYIGLIAGILLDKIECSNAIFGFAAGMFLYISLVDMVPEMNEVAEEASQISVKLACWTLLLQNLGIGLGVFLLFTLARYQDNIGFS